MSTAVAQQRLCLGCGRPVSGRRFCNQRCKQQAAPPKPKVYPHYVSAELREVLCSRHGNVFTEHQKHWHGVAGADWMTLVACPECAAEETARLERLKPKPSTNPCENLTCSCPVPKCPTCRQPMQHGPNPSRGWHSWICDCSHHARIVVRDGIVAPATEVWGSGSQYRETAWRDSCR